MKKKTNIYDSDDADRSKRLSFTPEERAARAQQKAEILGQKLERAEKKIPKKKKVRLQPAAPFIFVCFYGTARFQFSQIMP